MTFEELDFGQQFEIVRLPTVFVKISETEFRAVENGERFCTAESLEVRPYRRPTDERPKPSHTG